MLTKRAIRLLDAFHLALTIHAVYSYVVTGFGNVLGLEHIVWCVPFSRIPLLLSRDNLLFL